MIIELSKLRIEISKSDGNENYLLEKIDVTFGVILSLPGFSIYSTTMQSIIVSKTIPFSQVERKIMKVEKWLLGSNKV